MAGWRIGTLEGIFGEYTLTTDVPPDERGAVKGATAVYRWRCGESAVRAWAVAPDEYALHADCEHAVHREMARYAQLRVSDVAILRVDGTSPDIVAEDAACKLRLPADARRHQLQFRLSGDTFTVPVIVRVEVLPDPFAGFQQVEEIHAGEYLGKTQLYVPLLSGSAIANRELSIHVRESAPRPGEGHRPDENADGVRLWSAVVTVQ